MSTTPKASPLALDLLWEIPLAILSLCWFKLVKWVITGLYGVYLSRNQQRAVQWQILSDRVLNIPIVLPVLMTKGPRWNTHAVIGTVGPFRVEGQMSFDLDALQTAAASWTVVVYRYPSFATVTQINPFDLDSQQIEIAPHAAPDQAPDQGSTSWYHLACDAGRYCLGIRYYECSEHIEFPRVQCDGETVVAAQPTPADTNYFYADLIQRDQLFYRSLHYYIHPLLRLRQWLPDAFVQREYLPVGNPDTTFLFDALQQGGDLSIQVDSAILQEFYLYLSVYNRSSLPVYYGPITDDTPLNYAIEQDGFYLIRIRPRHSLERALDTNLIHISHP